MDWQWKIGYATSSEGAERIGHAVSLPDCIDRDRDGFSDEDCGGWDCDDTDPAAHLGADEICDDGIDTDCDDVADALDPDCREPFSLDLEAAYESGRLGLDFTLGAESPCSWSSYVILTTPLIRVIELWTSSIPAIVPPITFRFSVPFPGAGGSGATRLFISRGLGWLTIWSGF